jgi:hypothetical protein
MKLFLRILFSFLFIITIPICVVLFSIRVSHFSADYFKMNLSDRNFYTVLHTQITDFIHSSLESEPQDNPLRILQPIIEKEITETYLEQKVIAVLDDSEAWITGKSQKEPVISFVDIKEKLMKINPAIISQLETVEKEYNGKREQIQNEMKENSENKNIDLPELNISSFLKKDPEIKLGTLLAGLKTSFFFTQSGFYIVGILLLIYLGIIVINCPSNKARMQTLSIVAFLSAGWNYVLYSSTVILIPLLEKVIPNKLNVLHNMDQIIQIFTDPIVRSIQQISPYITMVLVFGGLLFATCTIAVSKQTSSYIIKAGFILIFSSAVGFLGVTLVCSYPSVLKEKPVVYEKKVVKENTLIEPVDKHISIEEGK